MLRVRALLRYEGSLSWGFQQCVVQRPVLFCSVVCSKYEL